MFLNIILFFFLISYSNCANIITEIIIDSEAMTPLNTSLNDTTYFYMTLEKSDIAGVVYFYITDKNYNLSYDNIQVCYTTSKPTEDSTLSDCEWKGLSPYEKTDSNPKEYFYKYNYIPHIYSRYLIAKYYGQNSEGELKAQSSLTDIYQKIKEKVKDIIHGALSVLAIIGIVIGSLVGLCIFCAIIAGIISCCIGEKNIKIDEASEDLNSKPAIEIPDKITETLNVQTTEETQN